MDKKTKERILKLFLVLSAVGFLVSLYLVNSHYFSDHSVCDFSETVSCSLVNSSKYSEIFNVGVAILGALWFVFLGLMSYKALYTKKDAPLITLILGWSILGLFSVIYLIIAEILLKAICPFCTVVHIIIVIVLGLTIFMYHAIKKKPTQKQLIKVLKPWLVWIVIINLLPFVIFNFPLGEKENYDAVAQCITEKGVNMYGSFRCGVCAKTRAMFDDSFQYINEIECHPQGKHAETERCIAKEIEGTPTWILEPNGVEQKRYTGFLSIEELKDFAGCNE